MPRQQRCVLLVDLNNFARYPTLPIGYLAAVLRQADCAVHVFAPLMIGIPGVARERPARPGAALAAKINHRLATSSQEWVRRWRDRWASRILSGVSVRQAEVLAAVQREIERLKPDVVLVSTYLMYRELCEQVCLACRLRGIPVLLGGPYFAQPEIIADWAAIPGLSGLIAGEVELRLPQILDALLSQQDPTVHPGVLSLDEKGQVLGRIAPPLQELDAVPFPDFSDFPWPAYPKRILPVITGRGCGWGVCSFCSDVTSTAGRTYRSRHPDNVLRELAEHHRRLHATGFVFTDLKLNSNLAMWRSIIGGIQGAAPGCKWIGAVHAGSEADNGLSERDLEAAAKAGCVRLTTGLETGSQRLADVMKKGTRLDAISGLLQAATSAGISMRCTMIVGHPGETAEDVEASAEFLARHGRLIERVSLNRFSLVLGTTLHRSLKRKPQSARGLRIISENNAHGQVEHHNSAVHTAEHRKAAMRLITEVQRINGRALSERAKDFEGVM